MITLIFVRGDSDSIIDRTIKTISNGEYCHVAIKFPWGIVESLGIPESSSIPGVRLSPLNKYDGANILTIDLELPNQAVAEQKAKKLIGRLYSYIGCIEGGIYDLFGLNLYLWISKIIDLLLSQLFKLPLKINIGEWTMNCSETATRILRAGGLNILPSVDADCITPMDLVRYFNQNNKEKLAMSEESNVLNKESVSNTLSEYAGSIIDTAAISGSTVITNWVSQEIERLRAEIKSTSSFTVAARNRIEIATLETMSVVALAELKNLTEKLKDKVS